MIQYSIKIFICRGRSRTEQTEQGTDIVPPRNPSSFRLTLRPSVGPFVLTLRPSVGPFVLPSDPHTHTISLRPILYVPSLSRSLAILVPPCNPSSLCRSLTHTISLPPILYVPSLSRSLAILPARSVLRVLSAVAEQEQAAPQRTEPQSGLRNGVLVRYDSDYPFFDQ